MQTNAHIDKTIYAHTIKWIPTHALTCIQTFAKNHVTENDWCSYVRWSIFTSVDNDKQHSFVIVHKARKKNISKLIYINMSRRQQS